MAEDHQDPPPEEALAGLSLAEQPVDQAADPAPELSSSSPLVVVDDDETQADANADANADAAADPPPPPPPEDHPFLPGITIAFDDDDDNIGGNFDGVANDADSEFGADDAGAAHEDEDPISAADDAATALRLRDASLAAQKELEAEQRRVADIAQRQALLAELALLKEQTSAVTDRRNAAESALVDMFAKQKVAPAPMDRDLTYEGLMARVEAMEDEHLQTTATVASKTHRLKAVLARDNEMVVAAEAALDKLQRSTFRLSVSEATGKPLPSAELKQLLDQEKEASEKLRLARIRVLALQKGLQNTEGVTSDTDKQSEGVHIMHYEQLKIENHSHHEKIEERNEDIMKLKAKITDIIQVLTHLKEKMSHVEGESMDSKERVLDLERELARKRDELSRTKHVRDKLRVDNISLKNRCGLVGNTKLLRDYESRHDEAELLEMQLEQLKTRYAEVSLHVQGYRSKLERLAAQPAS